MFYHAVVMRCLDVAKAWFIRDAVEASRHLRQLRLDRLSIHMQAAAAKARFTGRDDKTAQQSV